MIKSSNSILNWFDHFLYPLGLTSNKKYTKSRKIYFALLFINSILLTSELLYHGMDTKLPLLDRIWNCFLGGSALTTLISAYSLIMFMDEYIECIKWCMSMEKKIKFKNSFKESNNIYKQCQEISLIFLKGNVFIFFLCGVFLTGIPNLMSGLLGKYELKPTAHLPFLAPNTPLKFYINVIHQLYSASLLCHAMGLVVSVVLVTVNFCGCINDILTLIVKETDSEMQFVTNRWWYLMTNLRTLIDLQSEVNRIEEIARNLVARTLIAWVLGAHGVCFLCFVIIYIDPTQMFLFIAGISCIIEYFFICFLNDRLNDSHTRLYDQLCNIEWFSWSPRERKMLIPIILMSLRPKLLAAGGVQLMNYESFLAFIKRSYTVGIVVKDFFP